jgi:DNA recombination protein RmuC
MQNILPVLCFIAGFALAWLVLRWRKQETETAFRALSADALARNNQAFLDMAQSTLAQTQQAARGDLDLRQQAIADMVTPVRASLEKVDCKIQELEKTRAGAYAALHEQVRGLLDTQEQLRSETGKLVTALRSPAVRGRWGEIQLKRVVEMAGMLEHCDFVTQTTIGADEGRLRPDLLVRLPAGKTIVVDAKTPLDGYLLAIEAADEAARKAHLADHARQVRNHLAALARKSYWDQFDRRPVLAGRMLLQRRAGERPVADRGRGGAEHHPRHAHHADCAAASGGLRLAAGKPGAQRRRNQRARQGAF